MPPGYSIGDFVTILFFQLTGIPWPVIGIMALAIVNGILTSVALETFILSRQMALRDAFHVATKMSLISMVSMQAAMTLVDYLLTGGAKLTLWLVPIMLLAAFVTPPALRRLAREGPRQSLPWNAEHGARAHPRQHTWRSVNISGTSGKPLVVL
ncbi:MAG: DUF4396 domain-containing protein [Pseudomonadota bacterium]